MQMRDYLVKYDSLASEDTLFNIPFRKEYILSRIGHGKRVLDVGCLGGRMTELIMQQNNDVWGVEVNPAAASVAEGRGIRVKIANVEDGLPFENSFFDAVHAGEILEHLYDTQHFFREVGRVLKTRGIVMLTTPNLNSLENRMNVLRGKYLCMAGAYPEDHFGEHIRVFNLQKIRELCQQTGFELLELKGIPHLAPFGKWLDRPLEWMGRAFPSLSKLLMVRARKIE